MVWTFFSIIYFLFLLKLIDSHLMSASTCWLHWRLWRKYYCSTLVQTEDKFAPCNYIGIFFPKNKIFLGLGKCLFSFNRLQTLAAVFFFANACALCLYLQVWDTMIIEEAVKKIYNLNLSMMVQALMRNISVCYFYFISNFLLKIDAYY